MAKGRYPIFSGVGVMRYCGRTDAQVALHSPEIVHWEARTGRSAALGCNLAWGLVDAVMYLVRTVTDRGRSLTLVRSVRGAADTESGRKLIESSLSRTVAELVSEAEIKLL
jgi:hypothetical protein